MVLRSVWACLSAAPVGRGVVASLAWGWLGAWFGRSLVGGWLVGVLGALLERFAWQFYVVVVVDVLRRMVLWTTISVLFVGFLSNANRIGSLFYFFKLCPF